MTVQTYPRPPLTVVTKNGWRRTIRFSQIEDIEEESPDYTRVIYVNGRCMSVAMPFDELLALWLSIDESDDWTGR